MRKKGYIVATDFPVQIKATIDKALKEYKPDISLALAKAESVLAVAKAVEKFEMDQQKDMHDDEKDLEL